MKCATFCRKRMDMNKHEEVQEKLTGFVLGELNDDENNLIREHLEVCGRCREEAEHMRKVLETADCLKDAAVDEAVCRQARQQVLEAVEKLEGRRGGIFRTWLALPMVQYAAAAVLIAGAMLALHFIGPNQQFPDTGRLATDTHQDRQISQLIRQAETSQEELALAGRFFEEKNMHGLSMLLHAGREETKEAAAGYLSQIGDSSVLEPLEALAGQWRGRPEDNPYRKAIEAIEQREAARPEKETNLPAH